jgi:hypothetical protein
MKKFLSLFVILFLAGASKAYSQDMSSEDMQKWMTSMTPSAVHQQLALGAGTWNMKTTMWMAPGAEPMVSTGTSVNTMILGGRYLQGNVSASMMGMPFEGISLTGYDNTTQKFMNVWVDNMSTGMMYATGTASPDGKSVTLTGTMADPLTGKLCNIREVMTFNADGSMTMEMYGPDANGNEFKTMVVEYTK